MANIQITNEDNLALMSRYTDKYFDLAIVDPPYGISASEMTMGLGKKKWKKGKKWDKEPPTDDYFKDLFRVSKNQIIWGGNYFPQLWVNACKCFIYWHKENPLPSFSDGELAWTSFNKVAKQFFYRYYGNLEGNTSTKEKIHPTQKPVKLYEWLLINYANPGDKILDTHLGSGSIAIACHNLGFDLTACELDKDYYEAALKRLNQHQQQLTMLL